MTAIDQKQLGKTLWAIADDLRGAMNAGDFLDAGLAAESRKLDALKVHTRGLMQQLFPWPEGR